MPISAVDIIMGNIELGQTSRRKPIFAQRPNSKPNTVPSPRPRSNNPYQTLRFSNQPQKPINYDYIDTNRTSKPPQMAQQRSIPRNTQLSSEACRVNNLNEFLIELRRQINEQSIQQSRVSAAEGQSESRELVLNFQLQNEKLQLEKYKRMVERELGKSHSIEQIKLEGNESEKKLTIRYEELPDRGKPNNMQAPTQLRGSTTPNKFERLEVLRDRNRPNNFQGMAETSRWSLGQKIREEQSTYSKKLNQARMLHKELMERAAMLEKMVDQYEINRAQEGQTERKKEIEQSWDGQIIEQSQRSRFSKIAGLMKGIDQLHRSQKLIQNQVRAALENKYDTQSDYSAGFRQQP